jgi:ketosteroid isomerase-like protein
MHPNERLLRREYDARTQLDDASLAALLTEAAVWHVPGRSAISGEYRGKDEVMEYVRRRRDLAPTPSKSPCMTFWQTMSTDSSSLRGEPSEAARRLSGVPTACIGSRTARLPNAGCSQRIKLSSTKSGPE